MTATTSPVVGTTPTRTPLHLDAVRMMLRGGTSSLLDAVAGTGQHPRHAVTLLAAGHHADAITAAITSGTDICAWAQASTLGTPA
jgi:hypothetical protein